jgi:hypothetical protein
MFLNLFSSLMAEWLDCSDEEESYKTYTSTYYNNNYPYSKNSANLELLEKYPFASGFVYINDRDSSDQYVITYEVLKNLNLIRGADYEFGSNSLLFKTSDNKKNYDKLSTEIADYARAAMLFRDIDKKEMGILSFIEENNFYITMRPKHNKEKELLKEITLFYKSHGYSVTDRNFQENFFRYKNYAIIFYVKDAAMAAELNFYISAKDLGIIL